MTTKFQILHSHNLCLHEVIVFQFMRQARKIRANLCDYVNVEALRSSIDPVLVLQSEPWLEGVGVVTMHPHQRFTKGFYIELAAFSDSIYDRGKVNFDWLKCSLWRENFRLKMLWTIFANLMMIGSSQSTHQRIISSWKKCCSVPFLEAYSRTNHWDMERKR